MSAMNWESPRVDPYAPWRVPPADAVSIEPASLTPKDLIAFEQEMTRIYETSVIKAPMHLSGGNEEQLINIFKRIKPTDWVLSGWRSHYHCLLKGVTAAELTSEILKGHSVSLCFPSQKILCSGIVGGIAPIAVGLAMAGETVHCFLGDMSAEAGIVYESMKYSRQHGLTIHWIIEDNGLSVCTDTQESWGRECAPLNITRYRYKLPHQHVGIGKWVKF